MLKSRFSFLALALCRPVSAQQWPPVDPAELAEKAPKVDKDADAEVLNWTVRVKDEVAGGNPHTVFSHYIRIKIFNNRGRNRLSTIDIPIFRNHSISSIAGRTIHPDGSMLELKKDSVYERNLTRTGSTVVKHKSFPMPGVEPGSIIEYQWTDWQESQFSRYLRLDFQREIPIREVRYYVKPYSSPNFNFRMRYRDFQCPHTPFALQPDGFALATLTNVPAYKDEPYMPPTNETRAWTLIYYSPVSQSEGDKYWSELGRRVYGELRPRMRGNRAVEQKAEEVAGKAPTPEAKLAALSEFCRKNVKNLQTDAVSAEDRASADKNRKPEDTLSQGLGTGDDIRYLFAAMAAALGYDARIAMLPRRDVIFFDRTFNDPFFLNGRAVAVNVDGKWRFYDPAATFISAGMLQWYFEGVDALITDPRSPVFVKTPFSTPQQSVARHVGTFKLSEDGTLDGDIEMSYTGHEGFSRKEVSERLSPAQREESFKKMVTNRLTTAVLTNIAIENATDPEKPFTYKAHINIPGYAERTGKRLFFDPSFFRKRVAARFPVKERKNPIYFHYPWAEDDKVTIEFPPGFELEEPRVPAPIQFGEAGRYEAKAVVENGNRLVFTRKFAFGEGGRTSLPVTAYDVLKKLFDALVESDTVSLTLRQAAAKTNGANQ